MARYVRRNKGTEIPGNLIFFDTESREEKMPGKDKKRKLTLRLWCATRLRIEDGKVTRRSCHYGVSPESFWDMVEKCSDSQRTTWLFAHNLAFDATMLEFWRKLDEGYFTTDPLFRTPDGEDSDADPSWKGRIVAERSPTYFVVRHDHRTYKFVDTCNYWPKSLDKIAGDYGLEKVPLPEQWRSDAAFKERCERDVATIETIVIDMLLRWQKEQCGVFQTTAASLAYTNWRHMCDVLTPDESSVDVLVDYDQKAHTLEREAYYGGRFQCFRVGPVDEVVHHLDINSLYPAMMAWHSFPRRFAGFMRNPSNETLADLLPCYDCAARVFIDSRGETFPVRIDGIQYHAYGKFYTSLCGPELQRALDSKSIVRILLLQWYSRAPIFQRWVAYWYNRKSRATSNRESDPSDFEFSKLILNSLSGKFAQHGRRWEDVYHEYPQERWGGWPELDADSGKWVRKRGVGRITQQLKTDGVPPHAFPIISATITAYAREYMRGIMRELPERSVYYLATDAIICNVAAYRQLEERGLVHETALGKFKVKGCYQRADILGSNRYSLNGVETAGGLLGKYIASERQDSRVETWDSLPGIINGGPRNAIVISESAIREQCPEHKGIIGSDGWWEPYCLEAGEDWRGGPPTGGYLRSHFPMMAEADSSH